MHFNQIKEVLKIQQEEEKTTRFHERCTVERDVRDAISDGVGKKLGHTLVSKEKTPDWLVNKLLREGFSLVKFLCWKDRKSEEQEADWVGYDIVWEMDKFSLPDELGRLYNVVSSKHVRLFDYKSSFVENGVTCYDEFGDEIQG